MKPHVFLHIGTNKTGTTAIQKAFFQNRVDFLRNGLLYPKTGCEGDAHYGLSSVLGFSTVAGTGSSEAKIKLLRNQLQSEIQVTRPNAILVSSEYFILPKDVERVRDFFQGFDITVVVYLRRHDAWWESAYNQAVKTKVSPPWGSNFRSYLDFQKKRNPKYGDYLSLLRRWSRVFGKENIRVRPYEGQQNRPTIVADMLQTIGYSQLVSLVSNDVRTNESLSFRALQLIDTYQRMDIDERLRERLLAYVLDQCKGDARGSTLPPGLRKKLILEQEEVYAQIAREYLGREDGQLFYDPMPKRTKEWKRPQQLTASQIVQETLLALGHAQQNPEKKS